MGTDHIQGDRSSVFERLRHPRQQSTSSLSFPVIDQRHPDRDSFMNQISTNNKQSK